MLVRLDHVALAARDLDAAARRLAALLGRSPSLRGELPGDRAEVALFALDNCALALLAPAGGQGEGGAGIRHLAFGSDDVDAERARLAAAGLEPGPAGRRLRRDTDSGAFHFSRGFELPPARTRGAPLRVVQPEPGEAPLAPAGASGAAAAAAVCALDHVVIRSDDPEAAKVLYGEGLGLRLALDRRFEAFGARLLFFRVGGLTLELAAPLEPPADPAARAVDRLWGLSYRVPDAEAARARLDAAGFDVTPVRPGRKPGTRVFTVRDEPLGVATLMLQPVT